MDTDPSADLRQTATLLRLITGYQVSQALYVAVMLGVAESLAAGPLTVETLAAQTKAHPESLMRLLRTLAAHDLLTEAEGERFALTPLGALLRADAPISLRDVILQNGSEHFQRTWGDLLHCVQTGESAMSHLFDAPNPFVYYSQHPDIGAMMSASFAAQGRLRAEAVVAAYDFSPYSMVVDVGGGLGQLLATILRANPALCGVLFDLPSVIAQAGALFAAAGATDRYTGVGGDMFTEVPAGGDAYILSCVIHDWDDAQADVILRNCRRAMRATTPLLLVERGLPDHMDASEMSQQATLSDLNMLVRTGGRERTGAEYRALLLEAGFTLDTIIPAQLGYSVLIGRPQVDA